MQPILTDSNKAKKLYAKAKTSADMDFEREREGLTQAATAGFADPVKNANQFGIREGMKIADLGSGSGHYVLAMAPLAGVTGKVYAVDVQKELLITLKNEAKKRGIENIEVVWGDIEKIDGSKLKPGLLNMVVISNTLFQVEHKDVLLAEAMRILRPGGTLIIIDWTESFNGLGPIPGSVLTQENARMLAEQAGFSFVREFDAGAHHYGLIYSSGTTAGGSSATVRTAEEVIAQELI